MCWKRNYADVNYTTSVSRCSSADKSCNKAIKFATHLLYFLNKSFNNHIVLCPPSSELNVYQLIVFNWNHFEMRLLNMRINFYLLRTFCLHLGSFLCCFFFHYVSAKFHLWHSSGDLPRPRIGMLSLVTVSPVITAFHSCCLSGAADRALSLYGSRWALSEDSGFKSYLSRPEVYLVKNVVPIHNVALKTYRRRWTIEKGGGWGSGSSALIVQHSDDDDTEDSIQNYIYIYIYIYIYHMWY